MDAGQHTNTRTGQQLDETGNTQIPPLPIQPPTQDDVAALQQPWSPYHLQMMPFPEEGELLSWFLPPVQLAEAQRNNDKAGRPSRNHGDGDESPRGRHCYHNTAGNQQMLPYTMERKCPVLWEKI